MSDARLPLPDRVLVALLLRGAEAEVVVGDIVEGYTKDLAAGEAPARARRRLRRQVVTSCFEWWRPGAVGERLHAHTGNRGMGMGMGSWTKDLKMAVRSLTRRPSFTLGVALTLGLGIGATVTIYSVVDGVMLRPLAYADPSSLVTIGAILPTADPIDRETGLQELAPMSLLNFGSFRERTRSFEKMGALESGRLLVSVEGDSQDFVGTARITADVLEILGGAPALGRTFLPEEYLASHDGASMITHGYWQRRYGGDPSILGQQLETAG